MDGSKPWSGLVADTLRRHPSGHHWPNPAATITSGDRRDIEVLHRTGSMSQSLPSSPAGRTCGFQRVAIPGYGGHVAGKVAENKHGGTVRADNDWATQTMPGRQMRRSISEPYRISANDVAGAGNGCPGLSVAPRIPGYMGTIPGQVSESVHGMRFGDANETAQDLRRDPRVDCSGWLKRGVWPVDRMSTYKWNNRFISTGAQDLFTPAQEAEAFAFNQKMGQTFGLRPPMANPNKPGDRYLHSKTEKKKVARLDPSKVKAAGASSYAPILEGERWKLHNSIQLGNGNQRFL